MKLFRRWLFNFAAAVSAALFVLFVILWPVNQGFHQTLSYGRPLDISGWRWEAKVNADSDGVAFLLTGDQRADPSYIPLAGWHFSTETWLRRRGFLSAYKPQFQWIGIAWGWRQWSARLWSQGVVLTVFTERYLVLPYWLLIAVSSVLPLIYLIRWRRRRVAGQVGRCRVCGYDLRATPDRCPECGAIPSAAKGAAT